MFKEYSPPYLKPPTEDSTAPASNRRSGMLLVVDDDGPIRDMLSHRLKDLGHIALGVSSGYEAMKIVKSASFDLILLDIMMPDMDGYQVLEQLKSDDSLRHIPVIMLTGLADVDNAARCIEMGAEDYLTKPVKPILLNARVDACLEKKQLRDQEVLHLQKIESINADLEIKVEERVKELKNSNQNLENQIAERKLAEQKLIQLSRHNELILESAGDGIFGIDPQGNTTFVNRAAALMLGYGPDELIGESCHPLIHHSHSDGSTYPTEECPISQTLLYGKAIQTSDDVFWRKDGTSFPIEYVTTPVIEHGTAQGVVIVFRDVTQARAAEEERAAELSRAADIQTGLLPEALPSLKDYDFHALCLPAREVGGDFYDWQKLDDERILSFVICDVMGKGVSAALLLAMIRATVRATNASEGPAAVLRQIDTAIGGDLDRAGSFATLVYCQLDLDRDEIRYADAGHGLALVVRADGSFDRLEVRNPPLGMNQNQTFQEGIITLGQGDALLLFTDGLMEGYSQVFKEPSTELSGILQCSDAKAIAEYVLNQTCPANPLEDDLTLVVVQHRSNSNVKAQN
ncbi:MAG: SpoIIE family protein phosphatase [Chloroflexi bacterium]|nr:SpoIIE family protein phosphatase [Chloroflexota bacterium]PKB57857.1 MAG: hypothetical protein BZY73_01000 [SAR202 cluster bacterium Casp-Chloro-G3]